MIGWSVWGELSPTHLFVVFPRYLELQISGVLVSIMWLTDRAKSGATLSGPLPEFINKVLLAHSLLSGIICGCFYIVAELSNCNRDPMGLQV